MSFLQNTSSLPAALVHRTGTMIRFTTAQLPSLPARDVNCQVVLPDGNTVDGHFRRNPANPYVGGRSLVRWIKTWIPQDQSVDIVVEQVGRQNQLRLHIPSNRPSPAPSKQRVATRRKVLRLAQVPSARKRREYNAWERDPALRQAVLLAWPSTCQVRGCTSASTAPQNLLSSILEVHHLISVSTGGSDSPTNVCLLCANHHTLIHRAPTSRVPPH